MLHKNDVKERISKAFAPNGKDNDGFWLTTVQLTKQLPDLFLAHIVDIEQALDELGFESRKEGDLTFWHCYYK